MKKLICIIMLFASLFIISCNYKNETIKTKTKEETIIDIEPTKSETKEETIIIPTPVEETKTNNPTEICEKCFKVYFDLDGGECNELPTEYEYDLSYVLPIPTKTGYIFKGWLSSIDNKIYYAYIGTNENPIEIKYKAIWEEDYMSKINFEELLNNVSDYVTESTLDLLPDKVNDITINWISSNSDLYVIKDGIGQVNKIYQTHQDQKITITCIATFSNGVTSEAKKEVVVGPIVFSDFPNSPIGTYVSVGAMSSYKASCERYKKEKTLFGDKALETLDIVYYAFINITSDGKCSIGDESLAKELQKLKANNIRIIGSISGTSGTTSKYFANITSSPELLIEFVYNLCNLVDRYNFDGLDIDWESTSEQYVVASGMNALCKALKAELSSRQADGGTNYLLTAAVPSSSWGTGSDRYDFKVLNNYLDYINLMSYDANNSSKASHVDPLYTSSYDNGYGFGCNYGVERLASLGFDKSKILIGLAGYGKGYYVENPTSGKYPALGSNAKLTKIQNVPDSYDTGTLFNSAIVILLKDSNYVKYTEYNNNNEIVASYLWNSINNIFVTYESPELIKAKFEYVEKINGLGIMCWSYCEDTAEWVIETIYNELQSKE